MIANRIHPPDKLKKKFFKISFLEQNFSQALVDKIKFCKLIKNLSERKKNQLKRIELSIEPNGLDNIFILLNFDSSRGF